MASEDVQLPYRLPDMLQLRRTKDGELQCHEPQVYTITVGRTRANVLHIPEASVSEKHATVSWSFESGSWVVEDRGSTNGTKVNGEFVETGSTKAIKAGDTIEFGQVPMEVAFLPAVREEMSVEDYIRQAAVFAAKVAVADLNQKIAHCRSLPIQAISKLSTHTENQPAN